MPDVSLDKIVSLAKRRGFVFPSAEIYGGLANSYDFGPLGAELLRNIKNIWWERFVHHREDILGLDASIITHAKIFEASGHTANFADAMVDCKNCKGRFRADHIIEEHFEKNGKQDKVEGKTPKELDSIIRDEHIPCSTCGKFDWTPVRKFNQLFEIRLGIVPDETKSLAYLRGETAQGIFTNFKNVLDSTRVRLPFGIAQIGKSFRNEITPGNFVFRTLEFEQGEIEYFFDPEATDWNALFDQWKDKMHSFIVNEIGIRKERLRWRAHTDEERSFYSKRTEDLDYQFPFGFKELWGIAYRTDYDLSQHEKFSGQNLKYTDPETGKSFIPHVIEPAIGLTRVLLMALCDAYDDSDSERTVLKLKPRLAPYKAAVFPLLANKPELVSKAREIYTNLRKQFIVAWDDRGNVGKRYYSQDEIGTPYCITVDFDTLGQGKKEELSAEGGSASGGKDTVTVRDRDTAKQERVKIADLADFLVKNIYKTP